MRLIRIRCAGCLFSLVSMHAFGMAPSSPSLRGDCQKIAAFVCTLEKEKMLGVCVKPVVELPHELLSRSKKVLGRLQYAATLLDCQQRILALAMEAERHVHDIDDLQQKQKKQTTTVAEHSALLRSIKESKTRFFAIDREITAIESSACDHYDKAQWYALRRCLYPLLVMYKADAEGAAMYDVHDMRWHEHAQHLFSQAVCEIDGIVADDAALQKYRFHAWNSETLLAPRTSLSADVESLLQTIGEQAAPASVLPVDVSVNSAHGKKHERRRPALASLLFVDTQEGGSSDSTVDIVGSDDLDVTAAFCQQCTLSVSSPHSAAVRASPSVASPVSPVGPVRDDLFYDDRVLVWHGPNNARLRARAKKLYPTALFGRVVAYHRIPFVLEHQFMALGQTEVRTKNGQEYRVLIFKGALVDKDTCMSVGQYEISRPIDRINYVVHRFFKVDTYASLPDGFVLPCGEKSVRMAACGSHYTVNENDCALAITEEDSWLPVTYVIFK